MERKNLILEGKRIKPNFFIVGAAKSGTSSLADYIGQHPDVFMSPVKEPFYFVSDQGLDDEKIYFSLFKDAGAVHAIGEASTGYLFEENAAHSIYKLFPEAKIIIILRNPVNMVFSYWQYMQIHGDEAKTFEAAISDSEKEYRNSDRFKRTSINWWASYVYLERALYHDQVKRFIDLFGRDRVKVFIFERFIKDPKKICQDTFTFLGVENNFIPDCKIINEGGKVRFRLFRNLHNKQYPLLRLLLPFTIRIKIHTLLRGFNTKKGEKEVMNPTTRKNLEQYFHKEVKRIESLLGYEIPEWRST